MATDFGFKATDKANDYYFISYNTEDSERISAICSVLKDQGLDLWYDEGIPHDSYWEGVLAEKIDKSKEVIFFVTKGIFEKGATRELLEIYTYKEYDLARRYKKKKLVVMLDDINSLCQIPYSMISWWQEIDPSIRQGVVSINENPENTAIRILKEIGIDYKEAESGWGPNREVFTMDNPAKHPTINSIIDNPTIGDERLFVRIGEITEESTNIYAEDIVIKPGRSYLVYIYCHNACSSTFFDDTHDYSGAVQGLKVSSKYPTYVAPNSPGLVKALICADNIEPNTVWASIKLSAEESVDITLEKPAKIYNDWKLNKTDLPYSLFSDEGTLIGMDELNGIMFGEESHAVITYTLSVSESKHRASKQELKNISLKLDEHR